MSGRYSHGVRVVGHDKGWVQTGFTPAEAEAEAERLTAREALPGVTYEAAKVGSSPTPSRLETYEVDELITSFSGVDVPNEVGIQIMRLLSPYDSDVLTRLVTVTKARPFGSAPAEDKWKAQNEAERAVLAGWRQSQDEATPELDLEPSPPAPEPLPEPALDLDLEVAPAESDEL